MVDVITMHGSGFLGEISLEQIEVLEDIFASIKDVTEEGAIVWEHPAWLINLRQAREAELKEHGNGCTPIVAS